MKKNIRIIFSTPRKEVVDYYLTHTSEGFNTVGVTPRVGESIFINKKDIIQMKENIPNWISVARFIKVVEVTKVYYIQSKEQFSIGIDCIATNS